MKAFGIHTLLFGFVSGLSGSAWAQAAPGQAPSPTANAPTPAAQEQPQAPVYVPAQGAPPTQEAPPPPPPLPAYYAPPPPPMETRRPGARLHDGFYLRMSFGIGSGSATDTEQYSGVSYPDFKFSGTAIMLDILIGGSPVPGFVLGGGLVTHQILSPTVKQNGQTVPTVTGSSVSLDLNTIGLFTAIYPDPSSGFNFHALVGYGVISYNYGDNTTSTNNPSGLSLMGGVGYDFWVSDQWSIGPDLRVAYAKTSYSVGGDEVKISMLVPTLSFTATYH